MSHRGIKRPWDKHIPEIKKIRGENSKDKSGVSTLQNHETTVPSIQVDGCTYFSDRFYLNRTISDDLNPQVAECSCGAKNPPVLFDRSRLVASLSLKAAIFATYNFEPCSIASEFPTLLNSEHPIPTLILHGQKGFNNKNNKTTADDDDDASCRSLEETDESQQDLSLATQEETNTNLDSAICKHGPTFHDRKQMIDELDDAPLTFFSRVLPTWLPPDQVPLEILTEAGTVSKEVLEQRIRKKGVHHPKYMLLFETSGSLVVVISTSNLNEPTTTDASWIQRFPPNHAKRIKSRSDFGKVLGDFLYQQTLSTLVDELTPLGFLRSFLDFQNLSELDTRFDFSKAQVHLIPTIPGSHFGRLNKTIPAQMYGRQRVAFILRQLEKKGWLRPVVCSENDRLVIQPTSFSADWNGGNMANVIRSYLGHDDRSISNISDLELMKRLDIVWPTEDFIDGIRTTGRNSPNSVTALGYTAQSTIDLNKIKYQKQKEGHLFLSSETFNRINISCLSQMVMFEPSTPEQRSTLIPHIKGVARLFQGNTYRITKDYGFGKANEYFPWFLLTSACLSRGAQGEESTDHGQDTDEVTYFNFELGVLFCSRLEQNSRSDRLYCFNPAKCSCNITGPRLIHLPIPFCLRPAKYMEDDDELEFCETPYFHEIPPGTGFVGNMRITPYGAALAEGQNG